MALASERTVWAQGAGLSTECVEALTHVGERAVEAGFAGALPAGDIVEWCAALEAAGLPHLSQEVREVMEDFPECFA